MNETDGDLLHRCRQGDQAAWHELVTRHTRKVFGVAYRLCGRVDEAEDLTQEVFVKVFRNLHRFQETDASFSTWLTAIARNQAIDHYRRRREERITLVRNGLRALPSDLREVLILCDLQGAAYEEIAQMLGVPLGTVKSRINRGRLELARRLLARKRAGAV